MKTNFKKSSSLLLAILAILFSVNFAQAQPRGQQGGQQGPPPLPNDEQIEEMVTELSDELSLSSAQEKQVSEAYFAHFEEVGEMTSNSNSRPDREVMEQMRSDFETEVKSYLTKDQQKTWASLSKPL